MTNLTGVVRELQKERERAHTVLGRLDAALVALGSLDGSFRGVRTKRRTMSAAGRARVAAAQRARWARAKGFAVVGGRPRKTVRVMSAAARRKIGAAKRRWWATRKAKQRG